MTLSTTSLKTILLAILLPLAFAGCTGDDTTAGPDDGPDPFVVRQIPPTLHNDLTPVVEGNNAFALDLYARLAEANGNLVVSPYSISTALAMTWAGARGITEAEMAEVLHFTLEQGRLHKIFGALQVSLSDGSGLGGYEIDIANRLWGRLGYVWLESFLAVTRDNYGAELEELDFVGDTEGSRIIINQWVEDRTRGKIEDLIPQGHLSSNTALVLTNAIYFKGAWASPFDADLTDLRDFHVAPGNTVQVPTMQQHEDFGFLHEEGVTVLLMPYQGKDLSMVFLRPDAPDGLGDLEARLDPETIAAWIAATEVVGVDVWLPRFKFTSEFSLNDQLKAMGMPSAFNNNADFSGMNGGGGLWISSVVHKAFIEVNEEGTEAAAATGVIMTDSVRPTFDGDHPFLFMIYDHVTESLLFVGRVADPSQ